MRIVSNSPSISRLGAGSVVRMSNDAYRGTARAYYALADTVGYANQQAQRIFDDKIETSTLKAINEYNNNINLLSEKYSAMPYSEDYLQNYQKEAEKLRQDSVKNLMPYQKATLAFESQTGKTTNINNNLVKNSYLQKEQEHKNAVYEDFKNTIVADYVKNPTVQTFVQGLESSAGAVAIFTKGKDPLTYKNALESTKKDYAVMATEYLLSKGDYTTLEKLEPEFKKYGLDMYFPTAKINRIKELEQQQKRVDSAVSFWQNAASTDTNLVNSALKEGVFLGKNLTGHDLAISSADNPDVNNLKPEFKNALPTIGGLLKKYDYAKDALITSGYRDKKRNENANGAESSYHLDGDALDIYLPQVGDDTQKAAKLYEVFSPYFKDVKYHDAGSGNHLHLAGYKGGLEGNYTDEQRREIIYKLKEDVEYSELVKQMDYEKSMSFGLKHILEQKDIKTISDVERIAYEYTRGKDRVFALEFADRAKRLFKLQQASTSEDFDEKTFYNLKEEVYKKSLITVEQLNDLMDKNGGGSIEQRRALTDIFLKIKSERPITSFFENWARQAVERYNNLPSGQWKTENINLGDLPPD